MIQFIQNKTEQAERRNQAIFLLTDLLPSQTELDTIQTKYSEIYNSSNIQVDLFIYFIGKDIPEIRTVQWGNKCLGNGKFVYYTFTYYLYRMSHLRVTAFQLGSRHPILSTSRYVCIPLGLKGQSYTHSKCFFEILFVIFDLT